MLIAESAVFGWRTDLQLVEMGESVGGAFLWSGERLGKVNGFIVIGWRCCLVIGDVGWQLLMRLVWSEYIMVKGKKQSIVGYLAKCYSGWHSPQSHHQLLRQNNAWASP